MRTALRTAALAALAATAAWTLPTDATAQVTYDTLLYDGMEYRSIGPERGGRSSAVAGIPDRPHTYLFGSTGGGVWKTTNAGQDWENLTDGQIGSASIGAVRVAESDPSVIYVGTGSACIRGNTSMGDGMYKSDDGGKTWNHIGLPEAGQIGRIAVHPRDADIAFVAAVGHPFGPNEQRGVFRTTDGGDTWEKVLFVSDSTGFVDLAMNPENPREIYAAAWRAERKPWTMISGAEEGGIWKTTDMGDSWEKLGGGLPTGVVGKAAVTVSPANPDRVWVLIEAPDGKGGVYRSDDAGETWRQINTNRALQQRAWYYIHIYADPQDENTVYALNTSYYKSVDGGRTFDRYGVPHGDVHDLWLNPHDPSKQVVADDGGAQVTLDGAESWSTYYNQPTAEFYRVFVDDRYPYFVYGPQQDNSTISVPSRPMPSVAQGEHWRSVGGCESGHIAIDPRDPNITYAGCYGGSINRVDYETGDVRQLLLYPQLQLGQAPKNLKYRFQWNAPIRLDPQDPDVLYHTSQFVHRTTDQGHSWETVSPDLTRNDTTRQDYAGEPITRDNTGIEVYGTIFAFEPSPYEDEVLWAGSDDGLVHISRDDGETWNDVTPEGAPEGTVNMIDLSPHGDGRAFIALMRYRLDDFTPYIYRTDDYGRSWTRLSTDGIPDDHFVRVIREDPEREGLLYGGTEYGMYVSFDDGRSWQSLQRNLPVTPITDLKIHRGDLVVATQGRSFWILDDLAPLRQLSAEVAAADAHLFEPRPAHRMQNVYGADSHIDVYLAEAPGEDGDVTIEILDGSGGLVRAWATNPGDYEPPSGADEDFEADRLEAEAGLNRMTWNLRYAEPDLIEEARIWGFTGGQPAPPGTYRVRLTAGGQSQTRTLEVRIDPRADVTAADLQEQFELMTRVREMLVSSHDAVRRIRSVREQMKERAERAEEAGYAEGLVEMADSAAAKLSEIEGELFNVRAESGQDPINFPPRIDNQIASLYGYIQSTYDTPNEGAYTRADDLEAELDDLLARLEEVMSTDVAAFNDRLREADVPPVIVEGGGGS